MGNIRLVCYTSTGYQCFDHRFSDMKTAMQTWREMRDEGSAHSYHVYVRK